jgi:tryptophan synthase alpha chain
LDVERLPRNITTGMNRIDNCFARLRSQKRKGFIPYICAGDPTLAATVDLALALEQSGADLLELGLPFSDPLADGIVNQLAAERALRAGATVRGVLDCIRVIRRQSQIPIVLYSYLNPVFQFGFEKFHREAEAAGVDGLLILDLPPEEDVAEPAAGGQLRDLAPGNLIHIRLIAPTTSLERIQTITKNARGFLYYISREGVTGARQTISASLADQLTQIRQFSELPIAVGFGVSNPEQACEVAQHADAVVVGSAIVDLIAEDGSSSVKKVASFARTLSEAIDSV